MIKCPRCESTSNQVTITRTGRGANEIRTDLNYTYRRRKCLNCGFMFSTRELTEEEYKKDLHYHHLNELVKLTVEENEKSK